MIKILNDALEIITDYLGPAAPAFLDRQIEGHIKIKKEDFTINNLPELVKWSYISGKLYLPEPKAEEMRDRIAELGKKPVSINI